MLILGLIALAGFILFWFMPQYGAVIFLPAMGAYFGARKAMLDGPAQPKTWLWGIFFVFVAIAATIRFLVPEQNFNLDAEAGDQPFLLWIYLAVLALAFPLFGYLAYLQRVGRTAK
ncbi:MAG: hypothetical protein ACKOXT_00255 [Actinomycetota bacterium]